MLAIEGSSHSHHQYAQPYSEANEKNWVCPQTDPADSKLLRSLIFYLQFEGIGDLRRCPLQVTRILTRHPTDGEYLKNQTHHEEWGQRIMLLVVEFIETTFQRTIFSVAERSYTGRKFNKGRNR